MCYPLLLNCPTCGRTEGPTITQIRRKDSLRRNFQYPSLFKSTRRASDSGRAFFPAVGTCMTFARAICASTLHPIFMRFIFSRSPHFQGPLAGAGVPSDHCSTRKEYSQPFRRILKCHDGRAWQVRTPTFRVSFRHEKHQVRTPSGPVSRQT